MRILYIACGSGSDPTVGGSLIRTVETARCLRQRHQIFFLTTSGGRKALEPIFGPVGIIEITTPLLSSFGSLEYARKQIRSYLTVLGRAFSQAERLPPVDLVYSDSDGLWDILPAIFYRRRHPGVKWVAMNHHLISLRRESVTAFALSLINLIAQRLGYLFLRRYPDANLVLDTDAGDRIKAILTRGRPPIPCYSVRDGVDLDFIRRAPGQPPEFDACFFGGFRLGKGIDEIVPLWKLVRRKRPGAKLVLIGGMMKRFRDDLERARSAHGLEDNLRIVGYVPDKAEAIRLVKRSRIFISLSHEEGWGIAIMECLAAGLPGVLWDLEIFRRIITRGVIKVQRYDLDAFAREVLRLLDDPSLYQRLKGETAEAVADYDWKTVAQGDEEIFRRVVEPRGHEVVRFSMDKAVDSWLSE